MPKWFPAWAILALFAVLTMTLKATFGADTSWEPFVAGMFVLLGVGAMDGGAP